MTTSRVKTVVREVSLAMVYREREREMRIWLGCGVERRENENL